VTKERKEGNLEFAGYQGCSGYDGCGIVVIYSVSELVRERESWYPRKEEGNRQFGSNQDNVGKGCQKSGCGGYGDCRVSRELYCT
jgi:hypothetical protein